MQNRPNASQIRLNAEIKAKKAAAKKSANEAQKKLVRRLHREQKKKIVESAIQGNFSIEANHTLAMGAELLKDGFLIFKKSNGVSSKNFDGLDSEREIFDEALALSVGHFISVTAQEFTNETNYSNWIRNKTNTFRFRAARLKDTVDDFALLNFLNSESYSSLGYDGGFNDWSQHLIQINRLIHAEVTVGSNLMHTRERKIDQIISLLPSTLISVERIVKDLIKTEAPGVIYLITWGSLGKEATVSDGVLNAAKMAWLAGSAGQRLMDFVFNKIQRSRKSFVIFEFQRSKNVWKLDGSLPLHQITIQDLIEIFEIKGFKVDCEGDDCTILKVAW